MQRYWSVSRYALHIIEYLNFSTNFLYLTEINVKSKNQSGFKDLHPSNNQLLVIKDDLYLQFINKYKIKGTSLVT